MFIYRKRSAAITAVAIAIAIGCPIVTVAQDNAQDETDERIRACGKIENATERMDCFNTVVEDLDEGSDVADASPSDVDAAAAASASEIAVVSEAAATTTAPSTAAGASAAASATSGVSSASEIADFEYAAVILVGEPEELECVATRGLPADFPSQLPTGERTWARWIVENPDAEGVNMGDIKQPSMPIFTSTTARLRRARSLLASTLTRALPWKSM